jgi:acylphosphatase
MPAQRIRVTGIVQGVGFRWFTRDVAAEHGVTGWVRNRRDGSVEAELHGAADALSAVVRALRAGPPHSEVTAVTVVDLPAAPSQPDAFEIRSTL